MKQVNRIRTRNERKIFEIYVEVLNIINKFNLTRNEKKVLTELLYQHHIYKNIERNDRHLYIFTKDNRKKMTKYLNMEVGTFNNILSKFRTLEGISGLILNGNKINDTYMTQLDAINTFTIQVELRNDTINNTE